MNKRVAFAVVLALVGTSSWAAGVSLFEHEIPATQENINKLDRFDNSRISDPTYVATVRIFQNLNRTVFASKVIAFDGNEFTSATGAECDPNYPSCTWEGTDAKGNTLHIAWSNPWSGPPEQRHMKGEVNYQGSRPWVGILYNDKTKLASAITLTAQAEHRRQREEIERAVLHVEMLAAKKDPSPEEKDVIHQLEMAAGLKIGEIAKLARERLSSLQEPAASAPRR
jgi:hypothetical protein